MIPLSPTHYQANLVKRSISLYISILFILFSCCCQAERLSDGIEVDKFVDNEIASVDVMVFGKSYCPYCKRTYNLFNTLLEEDQRILATSTTIKKNKIWTFGYLNIDTMEEDDGPLVQMELLQKTGQKTVPNIFIGGKHIGGNSDAEVLFQSGELTTMLSSLSQKNAAAAAVASS